MGHEIKRSISKFLAGVSGAAAETSLFAIIIIIMISGLALDYSNAVRVQAKLQAVADASALAGSYQLPEHSANATSVAIGLARSNIDFGRYGEVMTAQDVEIGTWDQEARSFAQVNGTVPNAVRVVARSEAQNQNAVTTFLIRLLGVDNLDVSARAIAVREVMLRCSGGGYFSAQATTVVNTNSFFNGFCLHGERGVTLNNNSFFEPGTTISMPDLRDFRMNSNSVGATEALKQYSHDFTLPQLVAPTIQRLSAGLSGLAELPPRVSNGPIFLSSIAGNTTLQPETLYIVSGSVNLGNGKTLRDVAIVAGGSIEVGSNNTLDRTILASSGGISFGSNNQVGRLSDDFCATGIYSVHLLAIQSITYNSNNTLRDVLMATPGFINTGNNNTATDGVLAEALGPISIGNANTARVCQAGLRVEVNTLKEAGNTPAVLVQ